MNTKQFKLGPAKTRSGLDAHISEEFEGRLYGRYRRNYSDWVSTYWTTDGYDSESGDLSFLDLMPNVGPEKYTFECKWSYGAGHAMPVEHDYSAGQCLEALQGKRTRVEVTILDDKHVCDHPDCEGSQRGRK